MGTTRRRSTKPADKHRDTYHHGDLKRALTRAALFLVAEKGPKGFTLTEAARRAGVSAAAPYRHFADKAQLLAAVAEEGFNELHATLTAVPDSPSDPRSRIIELGREYVRWAVAHPDYYQVMFGAETIRSEYPSLVIAADQAFNDLLDAVSSGLESGVLPDGNARDIAGRLWSLVHGVASLAIGGDLRRVGLRKKPEAIAARVAAQVIGAPER